MMAPMPRPSARAALAFGLGVGTSPGCGGGPPPVLEAVSPLAAHTDGPLRLRLRGRNLLPSYTYEATTGRRRLDPGSFSGEVFAGPGRAALGAWDWLGPTTVEAVLAPGLPPGRYAVAIVDARGEKATLADGFTSLGRDEAPPTVAFESPTPATPAAAGAPLALRAEVSDGAGALADVVWEASAGGVRLAAGRCVRGDVPSRRSCEADLQIPAELQEGDVVEVLVTATDAAPRPNRGEGRAAVTLRARPRVLEVAPRTGGIAGGTEIVVRGAGFLPGTRVSFGDAPLAPRGGTVVDAETIVGRAPPHRSAVVSVHVVGPLGKAELADAFEYRAPPEIAKIDPPEGSADAPTQVLVQGSGFTTRTRVAFGESLASALPLGSPVVLSERLIQGLAPAGRGRVSVWAWDPELGASRFLGAFTYR
jgi:hypothetical protein